MRRFDLQVSRVLKRRLLGDDTPSWKSHSRARIAEPTARSSRQYVGRMFSLLIGVNFNVDFIHYQSFRYQRPSFLLSNLSYAKTPFISPKLKPPPAVKPPHFLSSSPSSSPPSPPSSHPSTSSSPPSPPSFSPLPPRGQSSSPRVPCSKPGD